MAYPIKGKRALVTGANRGIGEAVVDALVACYSASKAAVHSLTQAMSQGMGAGYLANPKEIERQVTAMAA